MTADEADLASPVTAGLVRTRAIESDVVSSSPGLTWLCIAWPWIPRQVSWGSSSRRKRGAKREQEERDRWCLRGPFTMAADGGKNQTLPARNLLLWHKNHFERRATEKQQPRDEFSSPPPVCLRARRRLPSKGDARSSSHTCETRGGPKASLSNSHTQHLLPATHSLATFPQSTALRSSSPLSSV